ncbi:MAG: DNA starvation/stationary phase protection protein Dps [Candidatus Obscuribacterales bacterium]|nr:DNA starvation/stationary phase protection protein Dps [Candidatus Obscuribacterales bacterium]
MTTKQLETHMYTTHIDIPETTRSKVIQLLNVSLAASHDVWSQVKQAHWNVKGKDFYQLHLLFDEVATVVYEQIDELAERITTLGGTANGTTRQAAANSILPEYPNTEKMSEEDHINAVVERLALYGKHLREAIAKTAEWDEANTSDLYTGLSRDIDKKLWFVEAHVQRHR